MRELLPPAEPFVPCDGCHRLFPRGARHLCPAPPERLPLVLMGLDLDERLTSRQWAGADCALCARWLGDQLGEGARELAVVRGCTLRACAPACPPRR
ncbi:hypothetical protein [Streptomyces litchfieldiae]|uniref:Uncharacterized protein n=1 Tax=Streptomyces litchfieldiae TaxID=3075543 RepID=A0ABU2MNF2_9ACTN|nr:hypothetical protein [Streptomyces sp. DSM 44938]MDT0342458.1 hypothetical protein [Streptomyces sp. DSM 44938]